MVDRFRLDTRAGVTIAGYRVSAPGHVEAPAVDRSRVLLLHGYGGCKEELLGIALSLAEELPVTSYVSDLPGHGDSGGRFDRDLVLGSLQSLNEAFAPDLAAGHSIGARLALSLQGPCAVCALSPPLRAHFEGDRKTLMRHLRQRRVRETTPFSGLESLLEHLGEDIGTRRPVLLVHAANDLATVAEAVVAWTDLPNVETSRAVEASAHLDIVTSPQAKELASAWLSSQAKEMVGGRYRSGHLRGRGL